MDNTALGRDNVTFSLLKVIPFTIISGSGTSSWQIDLPVGNGLVIMSNYGVIDDAFGGITLNTGTNPSGEYNNNSFSYCAFYGPITTRNHWMTLTVDGTGTISGDITVFTIEGAERIGNFAELFAANNADLTGSLYRPRESTVCVFGSVLAPHELTGTTNNSWNTVHKVTTLYSLNVHHRAKDESVNFASAVNGLWCEIVPREKVRRKRFITRDEPLTKMERNVEIDWSNPLTRGLICCATADGVDLLQPGLMGQRRPEIERRGGRDGASLYCPGGAVGITSASRGDHGRGHINFPLTIIACSDAIHGGGGVGIVYGVGDGYWGGFAIQGSAGCRYASVVVTGQNRVSVTDWVAQKSKFLGLVYDGAYVSGYDGVERFGYTAETRAVVYDDTYGWYQIFGNNPNEGALGAAGNFYYGLVFNRAWTQQDFEQLNRNPFQIFKRRRVLFNGTPVIEHKRRRVL